MDPLSVAGPAVSVADALVPHKNLQSTLVGYFQSWVVPSSIGVGFFALVLLPHVEDHSPWSALSSADGAQAILLFVVATLAASLAFAVAAFPLLRLLEGYTLRPRWLKDRWIASQRARRRHLQQQLGEVSSREHMARLQEQLNQFPRDADFVLPTRLGNALRAAGTYGDSRYGLSIVGLWTRLVAVVDEKVTAQLAQSRMVLDFWVAMIALSGALATTTVLVAVWADDVVVLLWLLLLCGLTPLWYVRAIASVKWYAEATAAIADLGRLPLAEKLGIRLPGDLAAERKVWEAVSSYAAWGPNPGNSGEWAARIDDALVERGAHAAELDDSRSQGAPDGTPPSARPRVALNGGGVVASEEPGADRRDARRATAMKPARAVIEQGAEIADTARSLAKGTKWPGGALGLVGVVLIGWVVVIEEMSDRLTSSEFVASLVVGAALALAGPLVVVYSTTGARRAAVDLDVADKEARAAEAAAQEEAARRDRVETELELEKQRRRGSPQADNEDR